MMGWVNQVSAKKMHADPGFGYKRRFHTLNKSWISLKTKKQKNWATCRSWPFSGLWKLLFDVRSPHVASRVRAKTLHHIKSLNFFHVNCVDYLLIILAWLPSLRRLSSEDQSRVLWRAPVSLIIRRLLAWHGTGSSLIWPTVWLSLGRVNKGRHCTEAKPEQWGKHQPERTLQSPCPWGKSSAQWCGLFCTPKFLRKVPS
jgi:hypothetical protein